MKETSSKSNVYSSSSMGSNLLSTHLSESHNSPNDNINISEQPIDYLKKYIIENVGLEQEER